MNNQEQSNYKINFKDISARIRELRLNTGHTQESLSEQLGYSPTFVYQIEAGLKQLSANSLVKFALFFDVSLDYLIPGKTKPDSDELDNLLNKLTPNQRKNIYSTIQSLIEPLTDLIR